MNFEQLGEFFKGLWESTGIAGFFVEGGWKNLIMIAVACMLLFLAIKKKFEPYLLLPIAFGMLLVNLPFAGKELFIETVDTDGVTHYSGLLGYLYYGVKLGIYPCLIFLCIGATTDFGPLIANKKLMLLGAAAQIGIFLTFICAIAIGKIPGIGDFLAAANSPVTIIDGKVAASIGIIGGADGPTAILVTSKLKEELLPSISIAAYSYMALVPVIFPPIIKLLTTKKERQIKMEVTREVSKRERILFPIVVAAVVILLVPTAAPLIGCLMLGNLIKESGVVPKITETLANSLMYIVTILLGTCVGATATAEKFLNPLTLIIFALGIFAFSLSAASGVLAGKLMCKLTKGKVNPMIGAAGVSAVPMAARVVHKMGKEENSDNYLLMHAMGPNVAGVIGSAVAAGLLLLLFA